MQNKIKMFKISVIKFNSTKFMALIKLRFITMVLEKTALLDSFYIFFKSYFVLL